MANVVIKDRRRRNPRSTGALQNVVLNSAGISSIATDERGVIQILSASAERMLGYTEAEVAGKRTPADFSDPLQAVERARALSLEFATAVDPGFQALVFKASHGIEDQHELTWIRKDDSRLPAVISVTALCDPKGEVIGYLVNATDNTAQEIVGHDQVGVLRGFARLTRDMTRTTRISEPQQPAIENPEPTSEPASQARQPTSGGPRRSLLYVEDQSASFGLVERLVARRTDVLLLHASSAALGIELARSAQPDVILLNIDLPGSSALEFMKLLRADPATENTPLLALGADAAAKGVTQALDAGFFHYLTKPLKPEAFVEAVDYALEFAALQRAEQHDRAFTSAHSH